MSDCVFCKIAQGQIPVQKLYEDDEVLAFKDIEPKAPMHILVIPKKHLASILNFEENKDAQLMVGIMTAIKKLAHEYQIAQSGFRVVFNTGADGGQSINHLHFHLLGGRALDWPPG